MIIKIAKSPKQISWKNFLLNIYLNFVYIFSIFWLKIYFLLNFSIKMFVYDVDDDDWDVKSSYY